jgi:hypothetical protein
LVASSSGRLPAGSSCSLSQFSPAGALDRPRLALMVRRPPCLPALTSIDSRPYYCRRVLSLPTLATAGGDGAATDPPPLAEPLMK